MFPAQAPHDPDHLLLAIRIHEYGLWTAEIHRDGEGFFVLAANIRVDVPGRADGEVLDGWVDAAAGRVLAEVSRRPVPRRQPADP